LCGWFQPEAQERQTPFFLSSALNSGVPHGRVTHSFPVSVLTPVAAFIVLRVSSILRMTLQVLYMLRSGKQVDTKHAANGQTGDDAEGEDCEGHFVSVRFRVAMGELWDGLTGCATPFVGYCATASRTQ
jgi:hypothetical protein